MKLFSFIFNPSSTTKLRLRRILKKNKTTDFKSTVAFSKTIDLIIEKLKLQKNELEKFILIKQKEIDNMNPGVFKNKKQKHLDKIKYRTDKHFNKLIMKYKLEKMNSGNAQMKKTNF